MAKRRRVGSNDGNNAPGPEPAAGGNDALAQVPDALVVSLLRHLHGRDLSALERTCRRLRELVVGVDDVWRDAYLDQWPLAESQPSLARLLKARAAGDVDICTSIKMAGLELADLDAHAQSGSAWRALYARKARAEAAWNEGTYEVRGVRGSIGTPLTAIAIDDAESFAVVGSENGGIKLVALRPAEDRKPGDLIRVLRGHLHKRCSVLLFQDRPRCSRLVSCGWDGEVKVWALPSGQELASCPLGRPVLAARCLGPSVEAVTNDAALVRLECDEGAEGGRPRLRRAGSLPVGGLAGAPLTAAAVSARLVVVSGAGAGRLSLYERPAGGAGDAAPSLRWAGDLEHYRGQRHWRHPDSERLAFPGAAHVRCLAICGEMVTSGGDDGTCKVFDTRGGTLRHELVHGDPVTCLHLDPARVLVASTRDTVGLWCPASGALLRTLSADAPSCLAASDRCLLVGSATGRLLLFDFEGSALGGSGPGGAEAAGGAGRGPLRRSTRRTHVRFSDVD